MTLDLEKGFRALATSTQRAADVRRSQEYEGASIVRLALESLAVALEEAANDLEEQRRKSYGVATSGDEKTG